MPLAKDPVSDPADDPDTILGDPARTGADRR
jgi:hypothetical protein